MSISNNVSLIGRITKQPEAATYGKGKDAGKILRFSLAVRDGVDKDNNPVTQFISCVAWNSIAEIIEKYVDKGDVMAVSGKLQENNYTDDNDVKHYTTQVVIQSLELLPNNREDKDEEPERKNGKYHR